MLEQRKIRDEARKLSIFVKNIHPSKLSLVELWIFFKQYGELSNIVIEERKSACTVYFKNSNSAELVASKQPIYMGDHKIEIVYNIGQSNK